MEYCTISVRGSSRERNEDAYGTREGDIFVAADGVGGSRHGEVASETAVRVILQWLDSHAQLLNMRPKLTLLSAVRQANDEIIRRGLNDPRLIGMGTTIVVAFLHENHAYVVNVGDSRAYLIRPPHTIEQLSMDHTLLQELLKSKKSVDKPHNLNFLQRVITQSLGSRRISPHHSETGLREGDYIVLCTDGLTTTVSNDQIMSAVLSGSPLRTISRKLVSTAREAGGGDDITIVLVHAVHNASIANHSVRNKLSQTSGTRRDPRIIASRMIGCHAKRFNQMI
jgi:protein phosphatase